MHGQQTAAIKSCFILIRLIDGQEVLIFLLFPGLEVGGLWRKALASFSCSSEGNGFIKHSFCWLGYNDCSWERKPFKSFDQLSPHTIKFSYNGVIKLIVMCLCPHWLAERRDLFLWTTGWQLSNQSSLNLLTGTSHWTRCTSWMHLIFAVIVSSSVKKLSLTPQTQV